MSRLERINQHLKREISGIIHRELGDPRLEFISITNVDISPDLRYAKVYFSVFGKTASAEKVKEVLNKASGLIRKIVGKSITMRYTPSLHFEIDDTIAFHVRLEETLKDIKEEHENDHPDV